MDLRFFGFEGGNVLFQRLKLFPLLEGQSASAVAPFVDGFAGVGGGAGIFFLALFLLVFEGLIVAELGVVAGEVVHFALSTEHEQVVHHLVHEVAVVAHHDDAALEVGQVFLQSLEGGDVEVVGGLVEDEEVGGLHEHQTELEASALSAGELVDEVLLAGRGEEEVGEKLHGRHASSAAEVDHFGHVADHVDDLFLLVEGHSLLGEIAESHGFAHHKSTGGGGHVAEEHFDEGALSGAVVADDAHFLEAREVVVEIFEDDDAVVESFGDVFGFEDFRPNVARLDVEAGGALFTAAAGLLLQFVESFLA